MASIAPILSVGFGAVLAWDLVIAPPDSGSTVARLLTSRNGVPASISDARGELGHSWKGDRLAPASLTVGATAAIATIEVIGVSDAALVYRDRKGTLLYYADPRSNMTVVAKGVVLPRVTIQSGPRVERQPTPVGITPDNGTMPEGCEPSFSPISSPKLSTVIGRCIADNGRGARFALASP